MNYTEPIKDKELLKDIAKYLKIVMREIIYYFL